MSVFEREFYVEWISLMEDYSIKERIFLTALTDSDIEKKYLLALIKMTDEINDSNSKPQ